MEDESQVKITLPDGSERFYPKGITALGIALSISEGLARNVIAAKVNNEIWDPTREITTDSLVKLLTWNDEDGKATFWHSSAHLLAEALEALYPGVKFGTGPALEKGFYYDVDLGDKSLSQDDFPKIEAKMLELARQKNEYIRKPITKAEAIELFTQKGDEYKLELIDGLEDGSITLYEQGGFTDLCRGPHIPNTGFIKAVKLTNIGGAYWRNKQENKMLTRIYGITFPKQKELEE
jgi:threonyl-tRNA synthetase